MDLLTQVFQHGQRQDDPEGHKHNQVVSVQVPLTANTDQGYNPAG